eukprot:TRINITY_DN1712_c0_g1_i1.p1 TRINITY_DN1712_c0_g1~~TRINITY_DN1712_c0_g1_i1.p1  ORF type:complete len:249 (+),score=66.11 TRINITY_DN1712_c0_g1_i1:817-1563(+)
MEHQLETEPGVLEGSTMFEFSFDNAEKPFESYNGMNVRLRYFLKLTIMRKFAANITREHELWVINYPSQQLSPKNPSIKMEVGIEDCLHIEFEYFRSKFHLNDVILGKIYFLLVAINIKYMEIALIKKESTGSGHNVYNESDTLAKFEIMDGAPVRGEVVPIRIFLDGFDLTPTYNSIHSKYSVKYYLNLVLVDEEDRRYFKQTDIQLFRLPPENSKREGFAQLEDPDKQPPSKRRKKKKSSKSKSKK